MAELLRYIDFDGANGSGTIGSPYNSITNFFTGEGATVDLVTDGDNYVVSVTGSTDSVENLTTPTGWTTGITNDIEFVGDATANEFDDTKACISPATGSSGIIVGPGIEHITFKDIQFKNNNVSGTYISMVIFQPGSGASDAECHIEHCIVDGQDNRGRNFYFGSVGTGNGSVTNSIIYDTTTGSSSTGVEVNDTGWTVNVDNTLISNCTQAGIERVAGTVSATDTVIADCGTDFLGTITVDYCASDDGTGTNAQTLSVTRSDDFTDYVAYDFEPVGTGVLSGNASDSGDIGPIYVSSSVVPPAVYANSNQIIY